MTLQECYEVAGEKFPFTVTWSGWSNNENTPFQITGFKTDGQAGWDHKGQGPYKGGWFEKNSDADFKFIPESSKIRLEVGKKYKTRDGKTIVITTKYNGTTPREKEQIGYFSGETLDKKALWNFDFDGFWTRGNINPQDHYANWDLIEEVVEKKLVLTLGKKYRMRNGDIVEFVGARPSGGGFHYWLNHKDYPDGNLFYYDTYNGKHNMLPKYPQLELIEEIMEPKLFTLQQLLDSYPLPLKVRVTKPYANGTEFGMQKVHKYNTTITIKEKKSGNVYFEEGGYVGIKSLIGEHPFWEISNSVSNETEKLEEKPVVILTPEQEAFLKEKSTAAQVILVENAIRLALFAKTMNKVLDQDVEKVVDSIYSKKENKQFTQKQLNKAVEKAVEDIYG